uniref:Uncharacterized protein n=1 Tax=Opuntia streptacantha TaxID=393608 RepID=A0A7C9A9Z7_OPUST
MLSSKSSANLKLKVNETVGCDGPKFLYLISLFLSHSFAFGGTVSSMKPPRARRQTAGPATPFGLPCLSSAFAVLPGFKVLLRGSSRAGCFTNHIHYSSYVRGVKSESFHEHLPIVFVTASSSIINSSSIVLVETHLFYFFPSGVN